MARRTPSPRRVRLHRSYTLDEAARLLGVHKNTVRNWLADGLPAVDDGRPILVTGRHLIDYLTTRRARQRQRCGPGEFYCFRCRVPRQPAGAMVDYTPHTHVAGNLSALCDACGTLMNRRATEAQAGRLADILDVQHRQPGKSPGDTA